MANKIAHFSCCRSPLPDLSVFIHGPVSSLFLRVLFVVFRPFYHGKG